MATDTLRAAVDAEHALHNGHAEPQPPPANLRVDGTVQLGIFDAGGKRPGTATVTLRGGKADVTEGQAYRKGDVIQFSGTAVVREVKQKDNVDKQTGIVVECVQAHTADVLDLRVES